MGTNREGPSDFPESLLDSSFEELLEQCSPLTSEMTEGLDELLEGVEYDLQEELPVTFIAPWEEKEED